MKKLLSIVLSVWVVISMICCVSASEIEPENNSIDLIEAIKSIDSIDEWRELLDDNSLERDCLHDNYIVQDFQLVYDENKNLIISDIVYIESSTAQTTTGSATHEERSTGGSLLYTLTVEGSFSRVSGSSCTCTSASGSFTHPILSFWRSTPSYSKGRVSATKAYAKMYGTASTIVGANSVNYNFYLYCTSTGTLSSLYEET